MANIICFCTRTDERAEATTHEIARIGGLITPDNVCAKRVEISRLGAALVAVCGAAETAVARTARGICLGHVLEPGWDIFGAGKPEGNYALIRRDTLGLEVLTDIVGGRAVWYLHDDDFFIASTSQRAIVALAGGFELNPRALPWMLSSGTLGPSESWDRRIRRLPADSVLRFDRRRWRVSMERTDAEFTPAAAGDAEQLIALEDAIRGALERLRFDASRWVLPLSGGYDSRALLCLLPQAAHPRTVTWGQSAALRDPRSDASIARSLAEHYRLEHEYYALDASPEPAERILDRFLVCGEGCVDRISGYTDGFQMWRRLADGGVGAIVRGDEAFGWSPASSEYEVRRSVGLTLCSDYANLEHLARLDGAAQHVPDYLQRRQDESLEQWRDRLYQQYRIPAFLAPLSALKAPYVETINPLLTREVVLRGRGIPDHLRTDKLLFRKLVESVTPGIPFAHRSATPRTEDVMDSEGFRECVADELLSGQLDGLLPREFVAGVVDSLRGIDLTRRTPRQRRLRRALSRRLPAVLKKRLKAAQPKPRLNGRVLAFRAFIASRMHRQLTHDGS